MTHRIDMRGVWLREWFIALLVLLVGATATLLTWKLVDRQLEHAERQRFNRYTERVINTIQARFSDHERLLESSRGLFYASDHVSRDDWRTFALSHRLDHYPGILGVGYIEYVPRSRLDAYLAGQRAKVPDFELKTEGGHENLFVITYIEPLDRNRAARGLDIGKERHRREAAERSVAIGETMLTRRITLVQDNKKIAGFLLLMPVFQTRDIPDGLDARWAQLRGWVYQPIRVEELMAGIVAATDNMVDFEVVEGEVDSLRALLFDADGHLAGVRSDDIDDSVFAGRAFHAVNVIHLHGRDWRIHTSTRPEFDATAASAVWVLPVGLALTLLATLLAWSLGQARSRAQALADEMTVDLLRQAQHTQAIVDNVIDGIITIDAGGRIESCNRSAERIFGHASDEMVGRNVSMLMPEPHRGAHDGYLRRYLATGERRIIGIGREVEGRRRDGSLFPMELAVTEIEQAGRRLFVGMVRDITERRRMERMKSEFVSTVSHELRTPLTSIKGALGLMCGGALGALPARAREIADMALKNSERLANLIDDLLDMEKIAAGQMRFDLREQPLMPLVEQALQANQGYAEQCRVRFVLAERVEGAHVRVDAQRLLQVLSNYLSNAAKFSPAGGTVSVSVGRGDGLLRVAVSDQGPGVPESFQDRIFQKFSQADASDTRQKGGTGLGLAITKELVERMGGRVGFHTVAGHGATFFFDLPEWHTADTQTPRI